MPFDRITRSPAFVPVVVGSAGALVLAGAVWFFTSAHYVPFVVLAVLAIACGALAPVIHRDRRLERELAALITEKRRERLGEAVAESVLPPHPAPNDREPILRAHVATPEERAKVLFPGATIQRL